MDNDKKLEEIIGIHFRNFSLLKEALTHRSYLNEHPQWPYGHNERLEFLGDAVLELVVSESLYMHFPSFSEGELTMLRASLVNSHSLSKVALDIKLDKFIKLSKGEAKEGGRAKEAILANALEALIGAIYLDGGINSARKFIEERILSNVEEIVKNESYKDPKSRLQEIIQDRLKITPHYEVLSESGPAHHRLFEVGVYFDEFIIARGKGFSKQEAEIKAAEKALSKINDEFIAKFK